MPARPEVTVRRVCVAACEAEALAFGVEEFCRLHRISLQLYYKMRQKGLTPAEFRVGSRVLISRESAERWRREREAATANT
jgi:hypothetical protein